MNLLSLVLGRKPEQRYSLDSYAKDLQFMYNGHAYAVTGSTASPWLKQEDVENSFTGYVQSLYKSDGVVFACMMARLRIFAQARFQWTIFKGAKPGPLFGTPELRVLERPWPNGSTSELLARMIQDADLAGQPYIAREGKRLRRLRPDWVSIILTAPPAEAVESDVAGYLYRPGGLGSSAEGKVYLPDEVTHWTPIPDPEAQYRGMSWLTPVLREIQGDKAASLHKLRHFENSARPHLAVSFKESVTQDQFKAFMTAMNQSHQGPENAGKTLYLGGGADVTVLSHDLKQLDYKAVTGAGETRIANAAGVPAVIVGLSEGLQGSSLNAGNYSAARRNFADGTLQDLWIGACASLETVTPPPSGGSLWFDKSEIPFLREDAKDAASIIKEQMLSIESGVRGGYDPTSVVTAVHTGDLTALKHTGLYSVQLQPPGAGDPAAATGEPAGPRSAPPVADGIVAAANIIERGSGEQVPA